MNTSSSRMHPLGAIFRAMQGAFDRAMHPEEIRVRGDLAGLRRHRSDQRAEGLGSTLETS